MNKPTDCNLWRRFVFLFCASLVACQAAYGDYKAGESTSGVGGSGAGGINGAGNTSKAGQSNVGGGANGGATSANACNSDGIYRCTDTSVDVCTNHQWKAFLSCTRDLCDAERGRCMTCAPGSNRCSAFNLQTCASTGDAWTTTAQCDTAEYCDSVSDTCFACLPGEAFCSGASLYRCNATQDGWNAEDCGSSDLCDSRAQTCGETCPSADWVSCNGANLIGCDGKGHHVQLDVCASSQLCDRTLAVRADDPTAWSGKCEAGCTPKTYQCNPDNPAELRACPPSGLGWEHVETCATAELCDAVNQQCKAGCGVPPGTYQCNGARLEHCLDDGTAFEVVKVCEDESHCNTQKHDCVACVPGEFQCTNASLQTCGNDLTWSTLKTCASVALCDATHGKCVDPACSKAGSFQCSGAALQQCAADLSGWSTKDTCATSSLCDAANGRCITPECVYPNTYRCQGNTRQICDDTTRKWKDVNTCGTDQVCDLTATSGCMSSCPAIPWRCNTVGTQTAAQSCSMVNGVPKWTTVDTCATAALCSVGDAGVACSKPVCDAAQYRCDGKTLQVCNTGRTGYDRVQDCASSQLCDAKNGQCDVCVPNTYSCYQINSNPGRQLRKCSADGQKADNVVDNCDTAAHCYTSSDGATGYCYRCDAGDSQCVGSTQIQTCASDRRSWNSPTACTNGCQDNPGSSDYCAACAVASEVQCVQTNAPGSTRTCSSDRSAWGNTTTCTKGLGCVDNGTADYCASECSPNAWACVNGTSRHLCNSDGKGWGSTISECADTQNLKACSGGQFSGTSACQSPTSYCANGQCVECLGTTAECSGSNQLRTCSNGKWVYSTCSGDTPTCSGNACVACTPATSSATCTDNTTRRYCTTSNTWATSACSGTTSLCRGGNCVQCDSSTYTPICADANASVQSCQNGTLVKTPCATDKVCYAASGAAAVCAPCNADTQPVCLSDGVTRHACVNGNYADTLCTGTDSNYCLNGNCAGCNASSKPKCHTDTTITTCDTTSGTWTDATCPTTNPVCDDQSSSGAQCVECHNTSGWQCTGSNTRHSCTNNKNVDETCASGQICDPADATCKAPTCSVNEYRCDGNTVQKCNATRTGWDTIQSCITGVCYSGACVTCTPGTSACDGTTGAHVCNSDGSGWGATTTECADNSSLKTCSGGTLVSTTTSACPSSAPICSGGQCVQATCNVGQTRCNNNVPQVCNATRTGWVDAAPACSGATPVCQAATGTCGCSTSADCVGTPGTPICSNGTCVAATCTTGQHHCAGNVEQVCNATGTGWADVTTCAGTTPVCQADSGTCGCSASSECSGTPATPICSNGTCIAATCSAGQHNCSGNTEQICNATGTGWTDVAPCSGITPLCITATGTCGCSGNAECAASSAQTPFCNQSSHTCVACIFPSDCSGTRPVCDSGACVACSASAPCPAGTCQHDGSCLVSDGG